MRLPIAAGATLRHFLRLGGELGSLSLLRQSHAVAITNGLHRCPLFSSALVTAYSLLSLPSLSVLVFHYHHRHFGEDSLNIFLHNSLLAALSRNTLFSETLAAFHLLRKDHSPDQFTLAIAAKAAGELADISNGCAVHSIVARLGFESDPVLSNSLMLMYFRCGSSLDACRLFDEMPVKSVASWNALITELTNSRKGLDEGEMGKLVRQMQLEGKRPDDFTISTILPLSGAKSGKEIHCFVIRNCLASDSDDHLGSCLIDMYSKTRRVDLGRQVFDGMVSRNVVTWTAMIAGYVENEEFEAAVNLFRRMQLGNDVMPNRITLIGLIPAIGSLAKLMEGKQIHAFSFRVQLNRECSLNNSLMDMYSKCGSLDYARRVFDDDSWQKDVISWSTMISSYGIHGKGQQAISLFSEMCSRNFEFDHVTSLAILSACARSGLTSQGLEIYNFLVNNHGVLPTDEMCSCIVDMLGRAGKLKNALDFILAMNAPSSPSIWGALFSSSAIHDDQDMQELASRFLMALQPENASNYVSVSNLHALSGRWDFVAQMRRKMNERGYWKIPGYSLVDANSMMPYIQ